MRICPLYEVSHSPWGGVNSFFRNMIQALAQGSGARLETDPSRADVILSAGNYLGPGRPLLPRHARNLAAGRRPGHPAGWFLPAGRNSRLVFRVDGLRKYYAGRESMADNALVRNLAHAGAMVFQSRFSRRCFEAGDYPLPGPRTVVRNGADLSVFTPADIPSPFGGTLTLVSSSWSTNFRKGFELIARMAREPGVEVHHAGRWPETLSPGNVRLHGALREFELAELLRRAHFFLFPSENESCSNAVMEALACGAPVLYHPSGGTLEQCAGETFGLPLPPDVLEGHGHAAFLDLARQCQPRLRADVAGSRDLFGFEHCLAGYLAFFEEVLDTRT